MTAQEIINQWNSMNGTEQFTFCENCVKRAIKQGRKLKAGYEFDDAVQSTVEGVLRVLANPAKLDADTERRESQGKAGNTLAAVVCRAANSTMGRIAYHSAKDSTATSRTITNESGDEIDILDTIAAADNVEESAIFRATLQQFNTLLTTVPTPLAAVFPFGCVQCTSYNLHTYFSCVSAYHTWRQSVDTQPNTSPER